MYENSRDQRSVVSKLCEKNAMEKCPDGKCNKKTEKYSRKKNNRDQCSVTRKNAIEKMGNETFKWHVEMQKWENPIEKMGNETFKSHAERWKPETKCRKCDCENPKIDAKMCRRRVMEQNGISSKDHTIESTQ